MNVKRKILVLDGDHRVADLISEVAREHHDVDEVHHATAADTALQLLKNEQYSAILSDVRLSSRKDGGGVEFIKAVDTAYGDRYFRKIIVMSYDVDSIVDALKSGAYVSIMKPLGAGELRQKLGMVLS